MMGVNYIYCGDHLTIYTLTELLCHAPETITTFDAKHQFYLN